MAVSQERSGLKGTKVVFGCVVGEGGEGFLSFWCCCLVGIVSGSFLPIVSWQWRGGTEIFEPATSLKIS